MADEAETSHTVTSYNLACYRTVQVYSHRLSYDNIKDVIYKKQHIYLVIAV